MKKPNAGIEVAKQEPRRLVELQAQWVTDLGLGKNPTAQFGAPVSFTSHLESITPGQTQVMGTSGLANGYRTSYVIDEIRMQAYMSTPSATVLQPSFATQFQFRTGAYAFSQRPVPMMLHQPIYNSTSAALLSSFTGGLVRVGDEARWLLAKPLWMAPGDQIQCSVLRDVTAASAGGGAFTVDVTYVGRSLKPGTRGPKIRYVPWIAHYTHDFDNTFSQSTTEFRNPFMHPLYIHRLIGKTANKATNDPALFVFNTAMLPQVIGFQYASIFLDDSAGYKITRDFAPVGSVFDTARCAWTFNRPIGPREQLNAQFRTSGTVPVTGRLFTMAMLGYREETA